MGYWYNPPPPPPAVNYVPPNVAAWSNVAPNPIGSGAVFDSILSTWPQESWAAQSGDIVASQLSTALANPQPQPYYGTRPLDNLIRSTWLSESWASQVLAGGGVGALSASVFTPPVAIAAVNRTVLATIRQGWPLDQWDAQKSAQIAVLFATTATPPLAYPSAPPSLTLPLALWAPESWYAQSEAGIASGIAQIQQPPIYVPRPFVPWMSLLRALWVPEDWPTQTAARGAGWIPQQQPVTPLPTMIRRLEIAQWVADTWGAQPGTRDASISAQVPAPQPYQNLALGAALRSSWPLETWAAQTFAPFAGIFVPPPFIPAINPHVSVSIRLWPSESWSSQSGARYAAWIPPFVTPLPAVIPHPEILQWVADIWGAQPGTRDAAISAGVPAPYPYANRSLSTAVRSTWLPEVWSAQGSPTVAGGLSPLAPPLFRAPSQFTISLWPLELWGAQAGARDAAIFATPQIIVFMPNVVGKPQNVAIAQLQSLFGAVITLQYVFSGAPTEIVVAQSIKKGDVVFHGEAVTLQISLGRQHGPLPTPVVESILVSNIPVIVSILPPNTTVIQ